MSQGKQLTLFFRIEADMATANREAELQKEVETRRIAQLQEKLRSEILVKANVEGEAKERTADADLYAKRAEAEGILARFEAESKGLQKLFETCDDPNIVMQYLMVDRKVYPELAKSMADGVRGMQPKINYWKTGSDVGNPISDVLKNIPASVDMLNSIGIKPPSWLMSTPSSESTTSATSETRTRKNKSLVKYQKD